MSDPRAQAEKRLAERFLASGEYCSAHHASCRLCALTAAKLAAEEIAKAVVERDRLWVTALDAAGIECDPPNNLGWHLVCADAESAKPEGGK